MTGRHNQKLVVELMMLELGQLEMLTGGWEMPFWAKVKTTGTLAAGGVADGGCILGLLAASAAMVSRISAIREGVSIWKYREG